MGVRPLSFLLMLLLAAPVHATPTDPVRRGQGPRFHATAVVSSAVMGAIAGREWHNTMAWGGTFGIGTRRFSAFVSVEHGFYGYGAGGPHLSNEVLNGGLGVKWGFFDDHLRASVVSGPAVLLTDSFRTDAGSVGLFFEVKPVGFRIPAGKVFIEIFPLSFSWVMPVVQGIPLVYLNYRTSIDLWFGWGR